MSSCEDRISTKIGWVRLQGDWDVEEDLSHKSSRNSKDLSPCQTWSLKPVMWEKFLIGFSSFLLPFLCFIFSPSLPLAHDLMGFPPFLSQEEEGGEEAL